MSSWETRRIDTGGHTLAVHATGHGSPLLVLHGFTGSTRAMQGVIEAFRDRHRVVGVDLLGHGDSDAPPVPERYRMERCVADLVCVLDRLSLPRAALLGYSMGGRVALALATRHPERMTALVVVGASAGLETEAEQSERRARDEALARFIEEHGLEPFVDRWMENPLFATQRRLGSDFLAAARAERLRRDPVGLAASLRGLGLGAQPALHERLRAISCPVLLVVGSEDARFRALAERMRERLPDAKLAVIPRAGHAAHLENPGAFQEAVSRFLADASRRSDGDAHPRAIARAIPSP